MNTEININQMRHFSKCYSNEVSFQCFSTNQHWLRPQKGIGWLLSRVQLAVEKLPRFVMDSWCALKEMAKSQYPKLWKSCKSLTWFNTSNWKVCSWKEVAFFFGYYFSLPLKACVARPVSQMEVGCSKVWGLTPTTQTQVGGTPHKPVLPAIQPRAPPATPDPKSQIKHPSHWTVSSMEKLLRRSPCLPE